MRLVLSASTIAITIATAIVPVGGSTAGEVSVERGLKVSIFAACHDCHTEGYRESDGKIDPEKALKGSKVGWRGPWGTTYAANLRRFAQRLNEDEFLLLLTNFQPQPPMPWFNIRAMEETDIRSLYRYIRSLGDPGEEVPSAVGPNVEPNTAYVVLAPPLEPKGCEKDLDCGVGKVCGAQARCVPK
jgi:hypothetical protein